MKTVILCGGKGTRFDEERPKGLAMIGDKPILHHVMDIYKKQGHNDFIVALGWKHELIMNYFNSIEHEFNVKFVNTGELTTTGERLLCVKEFVSKRCRFFFTYCDGLANINLNLLVKASKNVNRNKLYPNVTMTIVKPLNPFGVVELKEDGYVKGFTEKPKMNEWVNGGFFVLSKNIFSYINKGDSFEEDVIPHLMKLGRVNTYKHSGFWDTVNTPKDLIRLNDIVKKDEIKW